MLAEWPDTVSERAFNESAAAMAEHAVQQQFDKLSHMEVSAMIASAVSKTAVSFGEFKTMQLTETVISRIKALNADRGHKKKAVQLGPPACLWLQGDILQIFPGRDPSHESSRMHGLPLLAVLPHAEQEGLRSSCCTVLATSLEGLVRGA